MPGQVSKPEETNSPSLDGQYFQGTEHLSHSTKNCALSFSTVTTQCQFVHKIYAFSICLHRCEKTEEIPVIDFACRLL